MSNFILSQLFSRIPVYVCVIGLFPALTVLGHNISQIDLADAAFCFLLMLLFAQVVFSLFGLFVRDKFRRELCALTCLLAFFAYGHFIQPIVGFRLNLGAYEIGPHTVVFFFLILTIPPIILILLKAPHIQAIRKSVQFTAIVLFVMMAFPLVSHFVSTRMPEGKTIHPDSFVSASEHSSKGMVHPDIFYIILDGYSRSDSLRSLYDFDNSPFLDALRERGFWVSEESTTNYHLTQFSMSAALNMKYLEEFGRLYPKKKYDKDAIYQLYADNQVFRLLHKHGYTIHLVPTSGFYVPPGITADYIHKSEKIFSELQNMLLNLTPLPALIARFTRIGDFQFKQHRNSILYAFKKTAEIAAEESPKMVYAHIVTPHTPFVFTETGELVIYDSSFQWEPTLEGTAFFRAHNRQLTFTNKKIIELVDAIDRQAKRETIILIQSDHGQRYGMDFNAPNVEPAVWNDSYPNLMAYRLPKGDTPLFYEGMTPVNTFRLIFERYFKYDFQRLPDKNYYSSEKTLFCFKDVTKGYSSPQDVC